VRNLSGIVASIEDKEFLELTEDEKEALIKNQDEIEKELFVKSTRETIKMSSDYIREVESFSGVDLTALPDPEVREIAYKLDEKYKPILDGIVDFITGFRAAHLRILDPEKGVRLGGFFKWMLYNRFESDISSYYLTLKRLLRRNELILNAIETRNITELDQEPLDEDDEIDATFSYDFKEKLSEVIEEIKEGRGAKYLSQQQDLRQDISSIRTELA
jgi:hypothetical protein